MASGSGVGVPFVPPVTDAGGNIEHTLLSIFRFAEIMGIAGPHFMGASVGNLFPYNGRCNDLWYQYQWQAHDRVGRVELAQTIAQVENELAEVVGFWPAPKFIAQEVHQFPLHYRPEQYGNGLGANGRPKGINLEWGKFISAGQRTLSLVGEAQLGDGSLAFSDEDSDGWEETVTITLPTTLTTPKEIKVYVTDETNPEYEIRPIRSATITGGNVILKFWTWQFVDRDLWEAFPTAEGSTPVDISSPPTNCMQTADVYREYADPTGVSARFYWGPDLSCTLCGGTGCPDCALTTQDGCVFPQSVNTSFVVPRAATYNSITGEWESDTFTVNAEPDMVKVWYLSGNYSNRWLNGQTVNPMSLLWEKTIANMTVARLERPFCSCENLEALANYLRADLSVSEKAFRLVTADIQNSPFGTLRGEVMAWKTVKNFIKKVPRMALVN